MRILLDARYLDGSFSGIGTYSTNLIEHLSAVSAGHPEMEYLVLVRPGYTPSIPVGENVQYLTWRPQPVSAGTLLQLGRFVDGLEVDAMHSFFPVAPLRMRTPMMVTVHDLQPLVDPHFHAGRPAVLQAGYNFFYRYIYPAVVRRSKWVVCDSDYTRDLLTQFLPETVDKAMTLRCGLKAGPYAEAQPEDAAIRAAKGLAKPYFLYYGSTRPNKNIPMMVRAFARWLRDHPERDDEFVLILKKDRFFRDVERRIRHEKVWARVRVLDQVPAPEQQAILRGAQAMVFATKYEGFGFPPLEAMAAGVPVIAARNGSLIEICGDSALMVDPDDPASIAAAMGIIIDPEGPRDRLVERGRENVQRFDWTASATVLRDTYRLLF